MAVLVDEFVVDMLMSVPDAWWKVLDVIVVVMDVVAMPMGLSLSRVRVGVMMAFAHVHPNTDRHQDCSRSKPPGDWRAKGDRKSTSEEGGNCEVRTGTGCPHMT